MENFNFLLNQRSHSVAMWMSRYLGHEPQWSDLTAPKLKGFTDYLSGELSPNSVRTYIAQLKSIINLYKDEVGIRCNTSVMKCRSAKTTHTFLTREDLNKLSELRVTKELHQQVLDLFLLQAWTGCRLSDAMRLTPENIQDGFLSYISKKTKIYTKVPAKPIIAEIVGRIGQTRPMERSTYNRIISRLCRKAGITDEIFLFKSGKQISGPKWSFVSSHTARRSFATNLYDAGIEPTKISFMMGHSSIEMTQRYICSNNEVTEELLDFFK